MSCFGREFLPGCHNNSEHNWELMRRGLHIQKEKPKKDSFTTINIPRVSRKFPKLTPKMTIR